MPQDGTTANASTVTRLEAHPADRDWSGPIDGDPRSLREMLSHSAARWPDFNAFGTIDVPGHPRTHVTYAQFDDLVSAAARGLAGRGVGEGDRIALIMDNSLQWAALAFAANERGAAYTAMYTHQSARDWRYIIDDCEPTVLAVQDPEALAKLIDQMPDTEDGWPAGGLILISGEAPEEGPPKGVKLATWSEFISKGRKAKAVEPVEPDPDRLALLIYTSGTTGDPKGVMLSNWNPLSNIAAMRGNFPLEAGDRSAAFLPWAHSLGATGDLYFMLSNGIHVNLISDLLKIADECSEIKPHVLIAVPRVWNKFYARVNDGMQSSAVKRLLSGWAGKKADQRIIKAGVDCMAVEPSGFLDKRLDKLVFGKVRARFGGELRFCVSGGAALSPEVSSFLQRCGFSVNEGYGLSETSPLVSLNGWGDLRNARLGTVGRPVNGVRVEIDTSVWDDPDSPADGEIVVHGPNVMMGYWKRDDLTAEVIGEDGGFRTGDLGHITHEGYVAITGRVKEQFKLQNGKYVAPTPLEELLTLHPVVEQCMLDGRDHEGTYAVVHPNDEALRSLLKSRGMSSTGTLESLVAKPEVQQLVHEVLLDEAVDDRLWKGFEKPKGLILDHAEWTPDNGLLTPSFKARRNQLLKRHAEAISMLPTAGAK